MTATPGRRFGSVPDFVPGDSLSGHIGRFATIHSLRRRDALTAAGWPAGAGRRGNPSRLDAEMPSPRTVTALRERFGLTAADLSLMVATSDLHRPADVAGAHDRAAVLGISWGRPAGWFYAAATPVCPLCLAERPAAHQLIWRSALLPICLRHGLTLVSQCPRCTGVPYVPDPATPRRRFRDPWSNTACTCGARVNDLAPNQRVVGAEVLHAAMAIHRLLDVPDARGSAMRATDVAKAIRSAVLHPPAVVRVTATGQHDGSGRGTLTGRAKSPLPAGLIAELLPAAMTAAESMALRRAIHGEGMASARRSVRRAERGVRASSLEALIPFVGQPRDFAPAHLPPLLPLIFFNRHLADLLADACYAGDSAAQPSLTDLRRVASVVLGSTLWRYSLDESRSVLSAGPADETLRAVGRGLTALDRRAEFTAAVRHTAVHLLGAPRIDYQRRRAALPPAPSWLEHMSAGGIAEAAATAWLIEHHACVEAADLGWTSDRCMEALGDYDLGAIARVADDALVPVREIA